MDLINQMMTDRGLLITVLTIGLFIIYETIWVDKNLAIIKNSNGLALFLAVMHAGDKAFQYGNSQSVFYNYFIRIMKALILIIDFYILYLTINNYFYFCHIEINFMV